MDFSEMYLATINSIQVIVLAWIASEQRASTLERRRRKAAELEKEE